MNYYELKQKELLLKFFSKKLSEETNSNLNLEYVIKHNDKIITGTTLRNYNKEQFSVEKVVTNFNRPTIESECIDIFLTESHLKPYHINYLKEILKYSKLSFKSSLIKLISDYPVNTQLKTKELELYNIKFLESNLELDFLLVSETDDFEIISVNL